MFFSNFKNGKIQVRVRFFEHEKSYVCWQIWHIKRLIWAFLHEIMEFFFIKIIIKLKYNNFLSKLVKNWFIVMRYFIVRTFLNEQWSKLKLRTNTAFFVFVFSNANLDFAVLKFRNEQIFLKKSSKIFKRKNDRN